MLQFRDIKRSRRRRGLARGGEAAGRGSFQKARDPEEQWGRMLSLSLRVDRNGAGGRRPLRTRQHLTNQPLAPLVLACRHPSWRGASPQGAGSTAGARTRRSPLGAGSPDKVLRAPRSLRAIKTSAPAVGGQRGRRLCPGTSLKLHSRHFRTSKQDGPRFPAGVKNGHGRKFCGKRGSRGS